MSTHVLSRDPKGRQAVDLMATAYDSARLNEDAAQRLNEHRDFVSRLRMLIQELSAAPLKVLRRTGTIVPIEGRTKRFDPKTVMKSGNGLYVWDSFRSRVMSAAKRADTMPAITLDSADLPNDMYDRDIRGDLPGNHVFTATEFCFVLDELRSKQKGGESGALLNNGYANIFYVEGDGGAVFAVYVYWFAVGRGWHVLVWDLDDHQWYAGDRVFFRV